MSDHQTPWERYVNLWRKFPMPAFILTLDGLWFIYWFICNIYTAVYGEDGYYLGVFFLGYHVVSIWSNAWAFLEYTNADSSKDPPGMILFVFIIAWMMDIASLVGIILRLPQSVEHSLWGMTLALVIWAVSLSTITVFWYLYTFLFNHPHYKIKNAKVKIGLLRV
jgi:hypothetical protein